VAGCDAGAAAYRTCDVTATAMMKDYTGKDIEGEYE
jgi:hypothetical protein